MCSGANNVVSGRYMWFKYALTPPAPSRATLKIRSRSVRLPAEVRPSKMYTATKKKTRKRPLCQTLLTVTQLYSPYSLYNSARIAGEEKKFVCDYRRNMDRTWNFTTNLFASPPKSPPLFCRLLAPNPTPTAACALGVIVIVALGGFLGGESDGGRPRTFTCGRICGMLGSERSVGGFDGGRPRTSTCGRQGSKGFARTSLCVRTCVRQGSKGFVGGSDGGRPRTSLRTCGTQGSKGFVGGSDGGTPRTFRCGKTWGRLRRRGMFRRESRRFWAYTPMLSERNLGWQLVSLNGVHSVPREIPLIKKAAFESSK